MITQRVSSLALLLLLFPGCASKPPAYFNGPAFLRIQNDTGKNLTDVAFQGNNFSNIVAGATTPYQPLAWWPQNPPAVHIDISILSEGETNRTHYVWRCARGIPQKVTHPGNWTFVLTLEPGLEIKTQEDEAVSNGSLPSGPGDATRLAELSGSGQVPFVWDSPKFSK